MKKSLGRFMAGAAVFALMFAMTGCDKHRNDDYVQYTPPPPPTPYPVTENKDQGIKYAVLQEGSIITQNINNWHALSPEFFKALSGIAVTAPEPDKTYRPGAYFVKPNITTHKANPDFKAARITAGPMVPKELHGWAAVDQESFETLIKKYFQASVPK